jgi:hypothetical protein
MGYLTWVQMDLIRLNRAMSVHIASSLLMACLLIDGVRLAVDVFVEVSIVHIGGCCPLFVWSRLVAGMCKPLVRNEGSRMYKTLQSSTRVWPSDFCLPGRVLVDQIETSRTPLRVCEYATRSHNDVVVKKNAILNWRTTTMYSSFSSGKWDDVVTSSVCQGC